MNWFIKAAAFKALSSMPGGRSIYQFAQARITRSLDPTPARVRQKIDVGMQYWDWLAHQGNSTPTTHLDFGSGWHPTMPLLYYSLGVEQQHLFDIAPVLNCELLEATNKVFTQIVTDPAWPHRSRLKRLPELTGDGVNALEVGLEQFGMVYHAPFVTSPAKPAGTMDFASSTQVLLYVPREDLRRNFSELHRALKPGGKFFATIYLWDLHATCNNGLSKYNHLRYSPEVWERWINSGIMSYNRLKAADYRQLLEEAGFKVCHFDVTGPTAADFEELSSIEIHPNFNRYSREELGATHLYFVAEKV